MMNRILVRLTLFFVLVTGTGFQLFAAETERTGKEDIRQLNVLVSEMLSQSPDKALALGIEALKKANETLDKNNSQENKKHKADALKNLGTAHYSLSNFRQAL